MSKKSKELLDNLSKIIKKPNKWEQPQTISDCNKMWKSTIDSGINSLPTSYNKDKWIEAPDDEDGDMYKWFDRMFGGIYHTSESLMQKNGTEYNGKLYFTANDGNYGEELWVYDPSDSTTTRVTDIASGSNSGLTYNSILIEL